MAERSAAVCIDLAPPGGVETLSRRVVRALGWALSGRLLAQAASWLIGLSVIRLLTPDDFGLMALTSSFITLVSLMNELGIGAALVQTRTLPRDLVRQCFGIVLLVQLAFAGVTVLLAEPVAAFFGEPRLIDLLRLSSLQFAFLGLQIVPEALLVRAMNFRPKACLDTAAQLIGSVAILTLAWLGFGVWALVWGALAIRAVKALGFVVLARFAVWPRFSLVGMRSLMSFGGLLTVERLFWFLYTQADRLIVARQLGSAALGFYAVALELASIPLEKLGPVIGQVALPAFAELQAERTRAVDCLLKAIRLISVLAFPAMFGFAAVAPEFVPLVLGPHWHAAVLPAQLLALGMPLRLIAVVLSPFFKGLGHAGASLLVTMMAAVALPAAFLVAIPWGLAGIAAAWLLVHPIMFAISVSVASRFAPLRLTAVLRSMAAPACASLAMCGAIGIVRTTAVATLPALPLLLVLIATGVLVYGVLLAAIDREGCAEAWARVTRRGRQGPPDRSLAKSARAA